MYIYIVTYYMTENNNVENTVTPVTNVLYKNLVLSGGGIRGISIIGAIKKLIENNVLNLSVIESVAGSSVGSLIGLLLVIGLDIGEIWQVVEHFTTISVISPNPMLILSNYGIDDGSTIINIFENIIENKTGIRNINFKQLYQHKAINFTIIGCCLTTKSVAYFNHIDTPDFNVSTALRISISIPGIFTPVIIDGKAYVDGCLSDSYPMNLYDSCLEQTLGIYIDDDYCTEFKYLEEFITSIINLFMYDKNKHIYERYKNNTVFIENSIKCVSMCTFTVDNETKLKLFMDGIDAAKKFVANNVNVNVNGDVNINGDVDVDVDVDVNVNVNINNQ
jgi:NTE family protein